MSDGGPWQQHPGPGGNPPPPAPPPPGAGGFAPPHPPAGGYASGPTPSGPGGPGYGPMGPNGPVGPNVPMAPNGATGPTGRSPGKLVALGVGAALLVGAGAFAFTRMGGDESAGGAESPEAAGLALLAALENEDAIGMVDVLLPGERETLRDPMTELIEELSRLEVLSDDASLSELGGFDVVIEDEDVTVEETNVDDIVNLQLAGSISATVDGEALPIGDLVIDNLPEDADLSDADTESPVEEFDSIPLTAVEKDGRWYVSLFYTVAEQVRVTTRAFDETRGGIPEEGVAPTGGDSPEDAFDAFLAGFESLDVEAVIASLNPNEFEALQRYSPLFLDEAQEELGEVDVDMTFEEAQYETTTDGNTASISISYFAGEVSAEGETASFRLESGCLQLAVPDEDPIDTCELQDELSTTMEDMPPELQDILSAFSEAFEDYENPGITMKQVDGTWYLSPMATGSDQVLAFLRALDRDEIEDLANRISDGADEIIDDGLDLDLDLEIAIPGPDATVPDFDDSEITVPDFDDTEITVPDFDDTEITVPDLDDTEQEGLDACFGESDAASAAECFDAGIASGEIDPTDVPVYLRAPECGLAEPYWDGDFYSMEDAEFISLIEEAKPCFDDLVSDGTLTETDLPLEIFAFECLEGRNWYAASDDDEYYDRFFECAYS